MATVRKVLNMLICIVGIDLLVRMGYTYNDPVPVGMMWIGLVGLKCALEALKEDRR